MSQPISSSDLKRRLGAWLDWTGRTQEALVIETYGRPVAALLPYEEYRAYLAYRQARPDEPARHDTPLHAAPIPFPVTPRPLYPATARLDPRTPEPSHARH